MLHLWFEWKRIFFLTTHRQPQTLPSPFFKAKNLGGSSSFSRHAVTNTAFLTSFIKYKALDSSYIVSLGSQPPLCLLSVSIFSVHDFKVSANAADASAAATLPRLRANIREWNFKSKNLAHTNLFASERKLISCNYFVLTPWKHPLPIAARTQNNTNASFLFRHGSCFSCVSLS